MWQDWSAQVSSVVAGVVCWCVMCYDCEKLVSVKVWRVLRATSEPWIAKFSRDTTRRWVAIVPHDRSWENCWGVLAVALSGCYEVLPLFLTSSIMINACHIAAYPVNCNKQTLHTFQLDPNCLWCCLVCDCVVTVCLTFQLYPQHALCWHQCCRSGSQINKFSECHAILEQAKRVGPWVPTLIMNNHLHARAVSRISMLHCQLACCLFLGF